MPTTALKLRGRLRISTSASSLCRLKSFGRLACKKAAAAVSASWGCWQDKAALIAAAADEVIDGQQDDQFPLHVWQPATAQTNMNVNEVIANRVEMAGG